MATSPRKSLALDTNVLLDLAGRKDFAHEFREQFSANGYSLLVAPTAIAELAFFAAQPATLEQELADIALANIGKWKCQPFALSCTQLAIANRFAMRLIDRRLIPEVEQNDGKILAQSSLAHVPLLVTSDKHLLDIEDEALLLAFNDTDLLPVHPAHPKRLLKALR